jgi:sulfoacetaldehyde dehydrogenase
MRASELPTIQSALDQEEGKTMETLNGNSPAAPVEDQARREIESLVARARAAQAAIEFYTQEQADALAISVGWQVYKSRESLARLAVEEGGFGNVSDKITKIALRVLGTLADMASIKTCGVVEEDSARGLIKIAKPVGVIAALIPTTGPDATPPVKALAALKARNAIIISPHPRTRKTSAAVVEVMRRGCIQAGAPAPSSEPPPEPETATLASTATATAAKTATGTATATRDGD